MKITNNYNLPEAIYKMCSKDYGPKENRLSVTSLISPPLIYYLKLKHWDELEEDASSRLWALLGQSVHYILNDVSSDTFAEEKLEVPFVKWTIVGVSDNYKDGIIGDYKVTSVWSFLNGVKPEWEAQLNVYAWQWRQLGFPVSALRIIAILRDHQQGRTFESGYPKIPFHITPVRLWSPEEANQYVINRIKLFEQEPKECSPEEKWSKPDIWAVKKKGNKTAKGGKLCSSEEEASQFIKSNPDKKWEVEFRKGECVRCKSYCPVRSVCPYNKEAENETNNTTADSGTAKA